MRRNFVELIGTATILVLTGCLPSQTAIIDRHQVPTGQLPGNEEPILDIGLDPVNPPSTEVPTTDGGTIGDPNGVDGDDGGYRIPESLLFCGETGQIVLQKGQRTRLTWQFEQGYTPSQPLNLTLESDPTGIADKGTLEADGLLAAWYQAPASVPQEFAVDIRASLFDGTTPAVCRIRLAADDDLGVEDDGTTRGAVGNVYALEANTPALPDFSTMAPLSQIVLPNFDVPNRAFSMGFPGVEDLFEWFGIRFEARIHIPAAGVYGFQVTSDDGAILSIDGNVVVDNDGLHAVRTQTGYVELAAGHHALRMDYYQGPRYYIALQLSWKKPGDSAFSLVPPDAILRPVAE